MTDKSTYCRSECTQLKVALVQQRKSSDRDKNFADTITAIREAAGRDANLVVLQELHRSLYFCQQEDVVNFDLAETIPGPSTEVLGSLALELGVVIICSLFERRAAGLYHNTAVVLDKDGSIAGCYRKMHIPDDPGFYEKFYFTPGDLGFEPIQTSIGRLGVLICWDQWFPEAARLMAMSGADMLIYPTAIGWDPHDSEPEKQRQRDAWCLVQRAHAVANGLPVLSCNRSGFEPDPGFEGNESKSDSGILFWGTSFITGPQGELLAEAGISEETIIYGDLNLERSEDVRRIWPYMRDRRIDYYGDLLKLYRD